MDFAVFTLLFMVVAGGILLSCLMLALFRRERAMFVFVGAFASSMLSAFLLSLQANGSLFASLVLGNFFFLLGNFLLYYGSRVFFGDGMDWPKRFWAYLAVAMAAVVWFSLVQYNIFLCMIAIVLTCTVLFADFFLYMRHFFPTMLPAIRAAFTAAILVTEASYVGRVAIVLTTLRVTGRTMDSASLNIYILAAYTITSVFWLTTLILLDDSRLLEELRKQNLLLEPMAHIDKLTGLFNRNKLYELLSEYISLTSRLEKPICFILIDIDLFKRVNDTYGHAVGDETLKHLAEIIRRNVRTIDRVFRWGGEEFLVLAVGTPAAGGMILAENLRAKVEQEPFARVGHITASFGVAEQRPHERFEDWFLRTDYALYQAKSAGRNCVRRWDGDLPPGTMMPGNLEAPASEGFAPVADHPSQVKG